MEPLKPHLNILLLILPHKTSQYFTLSINYAPKNLNRVAYTAHLQLLEYHLSPLTTFGTIAQIFNLLPLNTL